MGGTINVAARFHDGTTICIDSWTNLLPRMIMNKETLSGDDNIVRETLMEVAAHEDYAGPQQLRSAGYGIVIIDFIGKTIHSKQGYTSFEYKTPNQLLDFNETGWKNGKMIDILSEEGKGLLQQERVKTTEKIGNIEKDQIINAEQALMIIKKQRSPSNPKITYLKIITDPMKVIEYDEDCKHKEITDNLRKAGFPMTQKEGLNAIFKQ